MTSDAISSRHVPHDLPASNAAPPTMLKRVLGVLWVVWAGLLFGGLFLGELNESQTQHIPAWCRMGSSLTLTIAAGVGALLLARTAAARYASLIAVGMALGFLGDLFNAGWIIKDGALGGMIAFGLGHIAYIAACLNLRRVANLLALRPLQLSLLFW
ncbi:MAG: hypothetical protein JNG90_17870, partial [Planctomycetaceae bacterium]|nr:hypothetical protein [Planctomycetaceae bacterium]